MKFKYWTAIVKHGLLIRSGMPFTSKKAAKAAQREGYSVVKADADERPTTEIVA